MNRKLDRLLKPGMGVYFFVMAAFCAAALLQESYWLAAAETAREELKKAEAAEERDPVIDGMVAARTAAKKAKNFAEADRIRDELKAMGVEITDTPQGTKWKRL